MLEVEVVEAEFKINKSVLVELSRVEQIDELPTDLLIQAIVGQI